MSVPVCPGIDCKEVKSSEDALARDCVKTLFGVRADQPRRRPAAAAGGGGGAGEPVRGAGADATLEWVWFHDFGDVYALLAAREGRLDAAARLIGWQDRQCREHGEREPNEARCRALADASVRKAMPDERGLELERRGVGMDEDAAALAMPAPQPLYAG